MPPLYGFIPPQKAMPLHNPQIEDADEVRRLYNSGHDTSEIARKLFVREAAVFNLVFGKRQ